MADDSRPCPACRRDDSRVLDSRPTKGRGRKRRVVCQHCGHRWTTYEVSEALINALLLDREHLNRIIRAVNSD